MFRLVTFDVVGTLLHFSVNPSIVYTNAAKKFGIIVQEKVVDSNFKVKFKEMSKNHPNFGQVTGIGWETWWHDLVVNVLRDSTSCEQQDERKFSNIANFLITIYKDRVCYTLADGVVDLLTDLKPTGVKMGIITNFDERVHSVLKSVGLYCYFDFIASSYEVGAEKPSPEIFRQAMKKASHQSTGKDCLHVGDKVETDYLGAVDAGWNAALIASTIDEDDMAEARKKCVSVSNIFPNLSQLKPYIMCNVSSK